MSPLWIFAFHLFINCDIFGRGTRNQTTKINLKLNENKKTVTANKRKMEERKRSKSFAPQRTLLLKLVKPHDVDGRRTEGQNERWHCVRSSCCCFHSFINHLCVKNSFSRTHYDGWRECRKCKKIGANADHIFSVVLFVISQFAFQRESVCVWLDGRARSRWCDEHFADLMPQKHDTHTLYIAYIHRHPLKWTCTTKFGRQQSRRSQSKNSVSLVIFAKNCQFRYLWREIFASTFRLLFCKCTIHICVMRVESSAFESQSVHFSWTEKKIKIRLRLSARAWNYLHVPDVLEGASSKGARPFELFPQHS